jgi:hypothetical protein
MQPLASIAMAVFGSVYTGDRNELDNSEGDTGYAGVSWTLPAVARP